MPSGPERLVLETCDELAGHGTEFVLDADIAGHLKMGLRVVRDCLLGLEREEFVDLAPLERNLKASVTPKGRQELVKDGRYLEPERRVSIKIVPKGLRSFDEHDTDFFLDLLPPPRRPDGLPESIHFWKVRIEETDPEKTFRVGVIFGPSGCGKSSLVKAGLLPRLSAEIIPIYIEATAGETEARLLRGLRMHIPDLTPALDLQHSLIAVKERAVVGAKKALLVIDQFEQWLHAKRSDQGKELTTALQECDGGQVQGLILVRDDFSMALFRFLKVLGIDFLQGQNSAVVDLFDLQHARRVLAAFGRGYGLLPDDPKEMTGRQDGFLDRSIEGLSQDGRVISVRLALFAEMVKGKPWTPETLKQIGGTEGVGVTFLEETFSARSAPPSHRIHQGAAQAVLKALLPESGTNIKGHMRSHGELLEASGYDSRPNEFDDLLGILDGELRLVTPTASEGSDSEGQSTTSPGEKFYQLTHDYLVPSLREWLTRKQKETRRGRAELRLAERAASWNAKPENRHLPSVWEWANIRLLTKKRDWTRPQRKMMRKAGRHHGIRGLTLAIILVLVGWVVYESYSSLEASALVESVRTAETGDMPRLIERLAGYRRWANPRLVRLARDSKADSKVRLHSSLALLPGDPGQIEYLYLRLLKASPTELLVIRDALKGHRGKLIEGLWSLLKDPQADAEQRFHAACALADYDASANERQWDAASRFVTDRLLTLVIKNPSHYPPLIDFLRPVRHRLIAPLSSTFRNKESSESERSFATNILADYLGDRPGDLADLLMDADPQQFSVLFPKVQGPKALASLESELAKKSSSEATDSEIDKLARRQANASVALIRLEEPEKAWPLLSHRTDPSARSYIVNWLKPLRADPKALKAKMDSVGMVSEVTPTRDQSKMDAILFHPETSMRRALILALGQYGTEWLTPGNREPLMKKLLDLYETDPDAGIHGAAEWTLRRWGQQDRLKERDDELTKVKDWGERRWYVNGQGQTFAVIDGPVEFDMGSPPTEPERFDNELLHKQVIPRRLAIATKEVTVDQFRKFQDASPDDRDSSAGNLKSYSPDPQWPNDRCDLVSCCRLLQLAEPERELAGVL